MTAPMAFKSPKKSTLFTSQTELEKLFSKHQVMPFLENECREAGFDKDLIEAGIPVPFGLDLLSQMILHKRANLITLVGLLSKHFREIPSKSAPQLCADMLIRAVKEDVIDYIEEEKVFVVLHDIDQNTRKKLDQFQYPLPMVEAPEPVTHNKETGYQTVPGSLLLKKNHHDGDICLDHINRVNKVALRLNPDVVAFVQNQWKNHDKWKPDETREKFMARKKAFVKYDQCSREVLTSLMSYSDRFWLTHKYDKRGRTYCQGYHATYQGNDWNKAVIEFAEGEVLNET